jgi:thymidylate synthase
MEPFSSSLTTKSFDENVANNKAALPLVMLSFSFYVADGKLSCQLYQEVPTSFRRPLILLHTR